MKKYVIIDALVSSYNRVIHFPKPPIPSFEFALPPRIIGIVGRFLLVLVSLQVHGPHIDGVVIRQEAPHATSEACAGRVRCRLAVGRKCDRCRRGCGPLDEHPEQVHDDHNWDLDIERHEVDGGELGNNRGPSLD